MKEHAPLTWSTVERKINDLIPYEHNPRMLTEEKKRVLANSLTKYGFVEIPVIDTDNKLLAGHQRCVVMKLLGRGEEIIDVRIPSRKLTEKEFKEYNIQSNVSIGDWDVEMLKAAFADIDLMALGLDIDSIQIPQSLFPTEEKPDEALEVPEISIKTPIIKPGDKFILNDHVLVCGDCRNQDLVMSLMDGKLARANVSDPPYNVNYEGEHGLKIENDKMGDKDFYELLLGAFNSMHDIAEPGSPIYIFFAQSKSVEVFHSFKDSGFKLSQVLIWVKNHFVLGRSDYHQKHEPIIYGWKEGAPHFWYGDRDKDSILIHDRPMVNDVHPTMKPVGLLSILIKNSTQEGDIIADLFAGSGSTMMSAEQLSRRARIMDVDPRYCEVIIRRYKNYMDQIGKTLEFKHENGELSLKEILDNV